MVVREFSCSVFCFSLAEFSLALCVTRLAQGDKVKKVRIFRAWFSHRSGAVLALKTFGIITEETFFIVEICFVTFEKL